MSNVQLQKCPNCLAPIRFDTKTGKMVCDFCDSVFDLEPTADQETSADSSSAAAPSNEHSSGQAEKKNKKNGNKINGFDFNSLLRQAEVQNCGTLPVYICQACGAELLSAGESISLTCPFCQSNVVLTEKISGNLRPDGIIPFKITPDKLPAAVQKYYRKKKYLPRKFFSKNTMGKVTGIYVPFWVFSGSVSGELSYSAETSEKKSRVGDYIVQNFTVWQLERKVSLAFKDIPVDASEKMDDALMDSLEPFDMSEEKPFDIRYLAGHAADRFDVAAGKIARRAKGRMCRTISDMAAAQATAGYLSPSLIGTNLDVDMDARYILLPVYQFDLEYNSEKYHFAVNGQTGKVIGNLPEDNVKAWIGSILEWLLAAAAIFCIPLIKYLLGG